MDEVLKKNRLVFWLGLILAIGFLSTSLLSYLAARNTVHNDIINQGLPITSDNVYSEVQKELLRPISISAQMAENTFLRDWVLNGEKESTPVTRYLNNIKQRFHADASFFISERTRRYYHPLGIRGYVEEKNPDDGWYFHARNLQTPYELNADEDLVNHSRMTVFVNYRLLDDKGNFLGITGVGMTVNSLQSLIEKIEKRFDRRVYFADALGKIVLLNSANSDFKNSELNSLQLTPGLGNIAKALLNPANSSVNASYQKNGANIQVYSRFIPELKWFLLVEQNETRAFAPFTKLLFTNLLVGALASMLVLSLAIMTVRNYQARLEQMATTDALTGALNRGTGEAVLEQILKDKKRNRSECSVVLFDIDNFKRVNDTHGHALGDEVIRNMAKLVAGLIRNNDTLIRWGGEEFLVVFKNCALPEATHLAEKIRANVAGFAFGIQTPVTVSMGVAQHRNNESITDLTVRADAGLYDAKRSGKNRVVSSQAERPSLIDETLLSTPVVNDIIS